MSAESHLSGKMFISPNYLPLPLSAFLMVYELEHRLITCWEGQSQRDNKDETQTLLEMRKSFENAKIYIYYAIYICIYIYYASYTHLKKC